MSGYDRVDVVEERGKWACLKHNFLPVDHVAARYTSLTRLDMIRVISAISSIQKMVKFVTQSQENFTSLAGKVCEGYLWRSVGALSDDVGMTE